LLPLAPRNAVRRAPVRHPRRAPRDRRGEEARREEGRPVMSNARKPTSFLDWNDKDAVRRLLVDARVQADDIDATVQDMFRTRRDRALGPALARETYSDAMRSLLYLLSYAVGPGGFTPPGDDGADHGDPTDNGGAGPV